MQTNFELIINLKKCALCIYKTFLKFKTINQIIKLFYSRYQKFWTVWEVVKIAIIRENFANM